MEVWKDIPQFNYEISNLGNVRRKGNIKNIAQVKIKDKTKNVILWKNGKQYCKKVHRLIAEAFIPNPDNLPQINHINNDYNDNRIENLRWCSHSHNNCNRKSINKTGYKGVHKVNNGYSAEIQYDNKKYYLGYYITAEDAFEDYKKKASELHYGFVKY